jgi:hypothetical protein
MAKSRFPEKGSKVVYDHDRPYPSHTPKTEIRPINPLKDSYISEMKKQKTDAKALMVIGTQMPT